MKYLNLFFQKSAVIDKDGKFKEWNAKNRIEKSSFINEISLENKAAKLPQDYMEREESQISLTEALSDNLNIRLCEQY